MTHKFNIGDEVYLRSEVEGLKSEIRKCKIVAISFVDSNKIVKPLRASYRYTWGQNNWNVEEVWEDCLLTPGEAATLLEECKAKVQLG